MRISHTGSGSSTSHVLSVEQSTGAGTVGGYALYVAATGANVEGLWVDAGTSRFDESITATGGIKAGANAWLLADPGAGGTISLVTHGQHCAITTGGAEARGVANPVYLGQTGSITLNVDGGVATVTFASNVVTDGGAADNVLTMNDAGDTIFLTAVKFGGAMVWAASGYAGGLAVADFA